MPTKAVKHPCARCGYMVERKETVICQDCKHVLSPEERKMWLTVDLSHEKEAA